MRADVLEHPKFATDVSGSHNGDEPNRFRHHEELGKGHVEDMEAALARRTCAMMRTIDQVHRARGEAIRHLFSGQQ